MKRWLMRVPMAAAAGLCAMATAGCGGGGSEAGEADGAGAAAPATDVTSAGGSQAGAAAAEKFDCPARIKSVGPAGAAGVATIQDVRMGMTFDEVRNVMGCWMPGATVEAPGGGFPINTYATGDVVRQNLMVGNKPPNMSYYEPGDRKLEALMMGLPGEEVLYGVVSVNYFEESERPGYDASVAALKAKYGEPTISYEGPQNIDLAWLYDENGKQVASQQAYGNPSCSVLYPGATGVVTNVVEGCPFAIGARVSAAHDNPGLARELSVVMADPDALLTAIGEVQAHYDAIEETRRAEELAGAGGPDL